MDEQIHMAHGSGRLALLVALLVIPAGVMADESQGDFVLRARLTAGFGAGTNQGLVRHVPAPTVIVRPAARVIASIDSSLPAPHMSRAERPETTVMEASKLWSESPCASQVQSLAELIRTSDQAVNPSPKTKQDSEAVESRGDGTDESIQVEFAPTVRRIALGTYDPHRQEEFGSDAVVRFAEPVDAKLFPRPKPIPIEVPRVPVKPAPSVNVAAFPHKSLQEPNNRGQNTRTSGQPYAGTVPAVLAPALVDPELSELIESSSEPTVESASTQASRWNSFSYERSRRLADSSGFELLPLDRLGSEE